MNNHYLGGLGNKEFIMYHYIEDKAFLKNLRSTCSDIVNQLVQAINRDGKIEVKAHLVGSGARNMETQNANEPVDLDYNLWICSCDDYKKCREIKEYIRKMFNKTLHANGWGDCEDSTSSLTTEKRQFKSGNKTLFSIDLAIVAEGTQDNWYRLIHKKTGFTNYDEYYWQEAPHSKGLVDKVETLKDNNLWLEVRQAYLDKKNMYLSRQDRNHPSFVVYIEAVNEIYHKYFR